MKSNLSKAWLFLMLIFSSLSFAAEEVDQFPEAEFSQQELDRMLAPIALYPDSLLSQILIAATYPLEVVEAARWSRAHPDLQGDAAVNAATANDWDPSVIALTAFPQVLGQMDEKLDWTRSLGDAFLAQQEQVMDTVQDLREKAHLAGNLQSNEQIHVEPRGETIVIEHAAPQVVYVPYYNPAVVYGPWWWDAYPPVYWSPWPGYYQPAYGSVFYWGSGITFGSSFFFSSFDWHRHHVIHRHNHHHYRHHKRHASNGVWRHNPGHRHSVPYRSAQVEQKYTSGNGGSTVRIPQNRSAAVSVKSPATTTHNGLYLNDSIKKTQGGTASVTPAESPAQQDSISPIPGVATGVNQYRQSNNSYGIKRLNEQPSNPTPSAAEARRAFTGNGRIPQQPAASGLNLPPTAARPAVQRPLSASPSRPQSVGNDVRQSRSGLGHQAAPRNPSPVRAQPAPIQRMESQPRSLGMNLGKNYPGAGNGSTHGGNRGGGIQTRQLQR
jgi:hypothetical protein